jgi:hypothetical protein
MLTSLQKCCRVRFSVEDFGLHEVDPETFLSRIIRVDEMCVTGILKQ